MVKEVFQVLGKRILLLIASYTLCRIIFYIFNSFHFKDATFANILYSFIHGIRFDISIIFLLNVPFIVLSILPCRFCINTWYQNVLKILFLTVNLPPVFANIADAEYFKFKFKRTTAEILGIKNDVIEQASQLVFYYWYLIILLVIISFLFVRYYPRARKPDGNFQINYKLFSLCIPLTLGLTVLGIRGGFQLKPLRPNHAFTHTPNVLGNLVLNTPFSFIQTLETPGVKPINYFPSDQQARNIILEKYFKNTPQEASFDTLPVRDNVVIIILESFSAEYLGIENKFPGYTPFLDSLARQGLYFANHYANGTTSIEALPAILASIPSLMSESYITSIYQTNEIHGIGEILEKYNYHTSFFHGGKNGTMGFDVFAKNAGFKKYFGLNEYPDKEKDYDGNWGIFDEPYLQYYSKKLSTFPQPFISGVFTLSSHQPYTIPTKYKGKFPKGSIEIIETIGYSDMALKKFFQAASKEPWFKKTLFVITADHTQERIRRNDLKGEFHVPLLLFHPTKTQKKVIKDKITQHVDIMPTILDYLNIKNDNRLLFGHSVIDTSMAGHALSLSWGNNRYNLIKSDGYLQYDPNGEKTEFLAYPDSVKKGITPELEKEKIKEYSRELKAYLQYFNNGLVKNNWYK